MELDYTFLKYHQSVIDAVCGYRSKALPPQFTQDWSMFLIRIAKPAEGKDPMKYHLVSGVELEDLSPRLYKAVHRSADGKPRLSETLRRKSYYVVKGTLHPIRQYAQSIQVFSLVAAGNCCILIFSRLPNMVIDLQM